MSDPFVDTDVIIRLLSGDDPQKQAEAAVLFEQVQAGKLKVAAPDTVIADAVYVLSSPRLYHLPRAQIEELLRPLVALPSFRVKNKRVVLLALRHYASSPIDFGDAMIVATMQGADSSLLYSYDTDFDRFPTLTRRSPGAPTTG
ncbi:PIN domain-containing protein [Candidatus Daviesbacteria bacterium]|nr:PIN domain-containing protein [Candidatus Daviesbacteria bacterium]